MIQQREADQAANAKATAIHLKSIEPRLKAIDSLIAQEAWNANSDQRFRQQLDEARATLLHPNHDPADLQDRLQQIDSVLVERKTLRTAELLQKKAALEATLAQVDSEVGLLSEPEAKPEHVPDKHGYADPMAGFEPEAVSEPELPKAKVTGVSLKEQIANLSYTAFERDFPLEARKEIFAAQQAHKNGNEVPAMEALAKYGEVDA
jgi:hypothetical protein